MTEPEALYSDPELLETLRHLLDKAEKGQIRGLAFAVATGPRKQQIGFTGQYWSNPLLAMAAGSRIQFMANRLMSVREEEERDMRHSSQ